MRRIGFYAAALVMVQAATPLAALAQAAPTAPTAVEASLVAPAWRVADLERSTKFYATALGLAPCTTLTHGALTEVILCSDGKARRPLVILLNEAGAAPAKTQGGLDKLVIRVPDLDGVAARLKGAGYPVGEAHPASGRAPAVLWIQDPDGHGLELLQGATAP